MCEPIDITRTDDIETTARQYTWRMTPQELTRRAQVAADAIRERDAAIIEAALEGMPQPDIIEATGLSRNRVRVIEREGGAPPRKRGRPRKDGTS
jgi:propanediol dehydratase small subunit